MLSTANDSSPAAAASIVRGEMLDESGAIGQIRQGVVVRHVLDAGLRLLALGNVLRKAEKIALLAGLVRYREILGCQDARTVVRV